MIFHDQASLDRLFPRLILHGILNLGCEQVMRFLGQQLNGRFGGEVVTDLRRRSEETSRLPVCPLPHSWQFGFVSDFELRISDFRLRRPAPVRVV